MKLGLDIHGVLDTNPKEFVSLANKIRRDGGEVHIITGSSITPELYTQLTGYNNGEEFWDYLTSIEDELSKLYPPIKIDVYGRPNWKDEDWDRFKGDYCSEHGIDVHYDDTERYTKYFTTTVVIYKNGRIITTSNKNKRRVGKRKKDTIKKVQIRSKKDQIGEKETKKNKNVK